MQQTVSPRAPARSLVPFLKGKIDELNHQPSSDLAKGQRAAYTRLSLMTRIPFRSLGRLRAQCEGYVGFIGDPAPYTDGLGRGYQAALVEIDRMLSDEPTA